jgi:beta-lactamase class A
MVSNRRIGWLGLFSGLCLLGAIVLVMVELILYSRTFTTLPPGLSLGGVPVGGLTESQAMAQLATAYRTPVELRYLSSRILLDPTIAAFEVNSSSMLAEAGQYRTNQGFWSGFWDYLWLKPGEVKDVPLKFTYSTDKLRAFLLDVAARYDQPGKAPEANITTLGFAAGTPGHKLDVEAALKAIDPVLRAPSGRSLDLPVVEQKAIRPSFDTLADLLRQDIYQFQFNGTLSLYLADLQTGNELMVDTANGEPITGPIAYSGMSTIKIPIMTAFFVQRDGSLSEGEKLLLNRSIDESQNTATDGLLTLIGGAITIDAGQKYGFEGSRRVTATMQRLGLANTYISGLLDTFGAVLSPLATPANTRADLNTQPDPYNQTTAEDMGSLLVMIEQCSRGGGGLQAAFPGKVTAEECRMMIDLLTNNKVGAIFVTGGTPEGVVAHKHGWDQLPLTNVADAALVFSPGAKYVLTIYVHRSDTMAFDEANRLIISLARAIYNYFNPSTAAPQ